MERHVGDRIRSWSPLHGPVSGAITAIRRFRRKVYYAVDWTSESGDKFSSRERAGRDDRDWIAIHA